jgi:hypothetical protein
MSTETELLNPGSEIGELSQVLARDCPQEWEKQNKGAAVTRTDCRSSAGIAVSLVDGMIATARILCRMDTSMPEVQEALKDLRSCSALNDLVTSWRKAPGGRIREDV